MVKSGKGLHIIDNLEVATMGEILTVSDLGWISSEFTGHLLEVSLELLGSARSVGLTFGGSLRLISSRSSIQTSSAAILSVVPSGSLCSIVLAASVSARTSSLSSGGRLGLRASVCTGRSLIVLTGINVSARVTASTAGVQVSVAIATFLISGFVGIGAASVGVASSLTISLLVSSVGVDVLIERRHFAINSIGRITSMRAFFPGSFIYFGFSRSPSLSTYSRRRHGDCSERSIYRRTGVDSDVSLTASLWYILTVPILETVDTATRRSYLCKTAPNCDSLELDQITCLKYMYAIVMMLYTCSYSNN